MKNEILSLAIAAGSLAFTACGEGLRIGLLDEPNSKWTVEPGTYTLKLGNSSRNDEEEITVTIK